MENRACIFHITSNTNRFSQGSKLTWRCQYKHSRDIEKMLQDREAPKWNGKWKTLWERTGRTDRYWRRSYPEPFIKMPWYATQEAFLHSNGAQKCEVINTCSTIHNEAYCNYTLTLHTIHHILDYHTPSPKVGKYTSNGLVTLPEQYSEPPPTARVRSCWHQKNTHNILQRLEIKQLLAYICTNLIK